MRLEDENEKLAKEVQQLQREKSYLECFVMQYSQQCDVSCDVTGASSQPISNQDQNKQSYEQNSEQQHMDNSNDEFAMEN